MSHLTLDRPTLTSVLGLLVIAGVVLLALVPNSGALPASSSCTYGSCSSSTTSTPTSWYVLLGALIIVAAALGILLLMRRRRASSAPAAVEPWSGPTAGAAAEAGAVGAGASMPTDAGPMTPAGGGAAPEYIETDSDVARPLPEVPEGAAGAAVGGAAAEGGGDIDSLMQELDKISGEILQRGKPKTPPANAGNTSEEGEEGSGQ